jgi:hypothetical protein
MQRRRLTMPLAPRTVHSIPDCLSRLPTTVLHHASTDPEPTNRTLYRKAASPIRSFFKQVERMGIRG